MVFLMSVVDLIYYTNSENTCGLAHGDLYHVYASRHIHRDGVLAFDKLTGEDYLAKHVDERGSSGFGDFDGKCVAGANGRRIDIHNR